MCGIAGIWNVPGASPAGVRLDAMLGAMAHRGPDGRGALTFDGGAAGMVRLALVDLSPRGKQPLWSPDRRVAILFNGEVYNFRDHRERLLKAGYPFQSTTDTEVVLALYLERGLDFVHALRGMFALAILDWRHTTPEALPELVLVRGGLGIKPLYVAETQGGIVFSSEVRALLASGLVEPVLDPRGLFDYLGHGMLLQPRTLLRGVRMLDPGVTEVYRPGSPVKRHSFWRLPSYEPRRESLVESAERLQHVLEESIRLHALADAPVGAFLSGGVDSAGIVGLMKPHVPRLRTYTLRFPDLEGQDEARDAVAAARHFGCEHTIVDVTGDMIADALPRFAGELDQPSVDGLNTWLISRAASRDVRAVLSGLGGDEFFAGYPVTRRMARYQHSFPGKLAVLAGGCAARALGVAPSLRRSERLENLATRRSPAATWVQAHSVFRGPEAQGLVGWPAGELDEEAWLGPYLEGMDPADRQSAVGMSCVLDVEVYMRSQLLRDSDATSMAHSLELRVPFVDSQVAEFSRTCRDVHKLCADGGTSARYDQSGAKKVLVRALEGVLPPGTSSSPKRGFSLPFGHWMQHQLAELVKETCHPEVVRRRGLLDPALVAPLWTARNGPKPEALYPRLWSLMLLELWSQQVLDRRWAPVS
jgi:asparagine synthase (glutamine-hydrolysing)